MIAHDERIIFLDSGAFSAFSRQAEIKIDDYINFIKDNLDIIEVYANLDVIGDPEGTLENQRYMESQGLKPLPCFHYGEDPRYLLHYISNYDYVAVGGMVPISTRDLIPWLDYIFSEFICDLEGMPKVKVHGFGLTTIPLIVRYPWFSVDSTSWVLTGRMGSIFVPKFRDGKYQYLEDPWKVVVSDRSPKVSAIGDKHFKNYPPKAQETIEKYLASKGYVIGLSDFYMRPEGHTLAKDERWHGPLRSNRTREVEKIIEPGLCNDYKQRDEINIIYFMDLEKNMPTWPWPFKEGMRGGFGLI